MAEILSFLGLAGYYRRFIPEFSRIAKPMIELLKKGTKFYWSDQCEAAFRKLRTLLTSAPILAQQILQSHSMSIVMLRAPELAVF